MKILKKPSPRRGVCSVCLTEFLIYPKDFKQEAFLFNGTRWMKCKCCGRQEVKVLND